MSTEFAIDTMGTDVDSLDYDILIIVRTDTPGNEIQVFFFSNQILESHRDPTMRRFLILNAS